MKRTVSLFLFFCAFGPQNSAFAAQCWLDDYWFNRYLVAEIPTELKDYFSPLSDRENYELKNSTEAPIYLLSDQEKFYDKPLEVLDKIRPLLVTPSGKVRTSKLVNGYEYIFNEEKMDWEIRIRERFEIDISVPEQSYNILFNVLDVLPEEKRIRKSGSNRPRKISLPKSEIKKIFLEKNGNEFVVTLKAIFAKNEKYQRQKVCIPCFDGACSGEDEHLPKELQTLTLAKSSKNILNFFGKRQLGRLKKVAKYIKENPKIVIQLEGHVAKTKNSTDEDFLLAEKLAAFAKNNLEENGVDREKVKIISYGSEKPLVDRKSSRKNYRLEFIPIPN